MKLNELMNKIGRQARYTDSCRDDTDARLSFTVEVTDAKQVYGVVKFKVKPVAGAGERWVNATSLTFEEATR